MADRILKNVRVGTTVTDLTARGGKILSVGKTDAPGKDCGGLRLLPGLFDIHTHGMMGLDTMDSPLDRMSEFYLAAGTTSFLPTTMTMPFSDIGAVIAGKPKTRTGAKIEGFHLEGPYIAESAKGAQNAAYLKNPDLADTEGLPFVKMITLAPELPGAMEFIRGTKAVVSIGHTAADYDTAIRAIEAGAACTSHTFNAMPPLHHRNPGVIGAAITKNIFVQVICDGIHIHPSVITMLYRTFGPERTVLISDSMRATGLSDATYSFGGQDITVKGGVARTQDGALAGSCATLLDCVKKAISFGIPEEDAFRMASETPANLFGMKKGRIEPGYDAEFLLLDEKGNLAEAIILD